MTAVPFDTHEEIKRPKAAGLNEAQAEAIVGAVRKSTELPDTSAFTTKADLKALADQLTIRFGVMLAAAMTILFLALEWASR